MNKAAKARSTKLQDRAKGGRQDMGTAGAALRSIYQKTVEEDVPADLLDILGKLG